MNNEKLEFYHIDTDYINYLITIDGKVSFNKQDLHTRPYVGFVLVINNVNYVVPLSSKIRKTNDVTTVIPNELTKEQKEANIFPDKIATIKFNCMIPIYQDVVEKIDLDKIVGEGKKGQDYVNLLNKEILFCSKNREKLIKKAEKTYKIYKENKPYMKKIIESCVNFDLLQDKMGEYVSQQTSNEVAITVISK